MRKRLLVTVTFLLLLGLLASTVWASSWGTYLGYPVARIQINGQTAHPSSPAIVIKGRTYVPLRFVSEALGAQVGWDAATYTVVITTSPGSGDGTVFATPIGSKRLAKGLPKTFSEQGVSVTLVSAEITQTETVLKVKVTNNTSGEVTFGASTAQIVAGSKQFDKPSSYDLTFINDLKPGVTKEGFIKFPAIPADVDQITFYVKYWIMPAFDMIEAQLDLQF